MILGCCWSNTHIPPCPSIPNFGELEWVGTPRIRGVMGGEPPNFGAAGMRLAHPWASAAGFVPLRRFLGCPGELERGGI